MSPAISIHHTETSAGAWDGPANERRLNQEESQAYYRRAYAWRDPDGDPETKAGYRFIHHEVSGDGSIGPANVRACQTGIAVLNGGRGGTTIPAADRQGVYNHLAAHLRDADLDPPDLRDLGEIERRTLDLPGLEVRTGEDGRPAIIIGYAALFDVLSTDLGGFVERIEPGAFDLAIETGADVRALWNHDPNHVLGRTVAQTLRLAQDHKGLRVEISPPDTSWANDLLVSIRRGDVSQMSFGFRVPAGGDRWESDSGRVVRSLVNVDLFDVSPVTFPAYPQTSLAVRDMARQIRADSARDDQTDSPQKKRDRNLAILRARISIMESEL